MHSATLSTAHSRGKPLWIIGPWEDLVFLVATPLLLLTGLSLARTHWGWASIAAFALIWSIGHHLPGMLRAYGDPRLLHRFPVRFVLTPLLLLSVATASFVWSLNGLFLVTITWGWWHYLMQVYGFVRIYDAKRGPSAALTRRLDRAMCIVWFAAAVILNDTPLYGYLDRLAACGIPLPPTELMASLQHLTAAALIVVTACFTANLVRLWHHGQPPNPWKLALMASAFAYFWYCNATLSNILIAYALFELFHDIQYLAIVWVFNRKRVQNDPQLGGLTGFLFRPRVALVGLYLALIIAYGSIDYGVTMLPQGRLQDVLLGLFLTSTLLHYYLDGFIWKLREASNQETLDVHDNGYRPLINMPQSLRHACYWCLLIVPLIGLNASQLLRPAPGLVQARQLAEITPASVKAQVRVARAWEAGGVTDRAIKHYQQAVELQPDFAPLQGKLASLLTRQGIALAKQGRREEAVMYFQRSLQMRPLDVATQRELNRAAALGP